MIRHLLIIVLVFSFFERVDAQWLDGGREQSATTKGNGCLLVHNGKMYLWNEENHFQVSADNGATWTNPPDNIGGANPTVARMSASGNRIYGALNFGTGNGIVIVSTDEGVTWEADTLGAPGHALGWDGMPAVSGICAFGDWLYIAWDQPVPNTIQHVGGPFVPNDTLNEGAKRPSSVVAKGDTLLMASVNFYYTTDGGATFVHPANTGYPGPGGNMLLDGNRIYYFAKKVYNKPVSLFYSDDVGDSWTEIDISSVMSRKIVNGDFYFPNAAFIKGNRIEFCTSQEKYGTPPNIWKSTDLGKTWEQDTLGIPSSFVGGVINFAYTPDGYLWVSRDHENIYKQKITGSTEAVKQHIISAARIVPNPSSGPCRIEGMDITNYSIQVVDLLGRMVRRDIQPSATGELDLSGLCAGLYTVRLSNHTGEITALHLLMQ